MLAQVGLQQARGAAAALGFARTPAAAARRCLLPAAPFSCRLLPDPLPVLPAPLQNQ